MNQITSPSVCILVAVPGADSISTFVATLFSVFKSVFVFFCVFFLLYKYLTHKYKLAKQSIRPITDAKTIPTIPPALIPE